MKWVTLIGTRIAFEKFILATRQTFEIGRFATRSAIIAQYWRIKLTIGNIRLFSEYSCCKRNGLFLKNLNKRCGKGLLNTTVKNVISYQYMETVIKEFGSNEEPFYCSKKKTCIATA
jgi:hypothetical protein